MRNIIKAISFAILAAIMQVACSNDDDLPKEWAFDVTVSDITAKGAVVTIRHNGINADTYQGFLAEGGVTDVDACIGDWLKSHTGAEAANTMTQRKKVIKLSGLRPNRTYTYIAFGTDGRVMAQCKPCAVTFDTQKSGINAVENPNWSITFTGTQAYNGGYYSVASLELNDKIEERYFFEYYPVALREQYATETDFLEYAFEQYQQQNNPDNALDTWLKILYSSANTFYRYLDSGDYVAYAIGATIDGEMTGRYAKTGTIHVDEYPVTSSYANVIGNWTLTDANGETCNVTFKKDKVNKSLQMLGFGSSRYPVAVTFDQGTSRLVFPDQTVAEGVEFSANGTSYTGVLEVRGWYINKEGTFKFTTTPNLDIARGYYDEATGCYDLVSGFVVLSGGVEYDTTMGIVLRFMSYYGTKYVITGTKLEFPITMTKTTGE